jgi:hypothetical protein
MRETVHLLFLLYSFSHARLQSMASSRPYAHLFRKARTKGRGMVARVSTVAFQGIEGVLVEVQVMIAPGKAMMQNAFPPAMRAFDGNDGLFDRYWRDAAVVELAFDLLGRPGDVRIGSRLEPLVCNVFEPRNASRKRHQPNSEKIDFTAD